jgi:hypothetical protein
LNQLKSSLQKREAELTRQFNEREQKMAKELKAIRMQGMDEGQRKQYETQLANEEFQTLQAQLEEEKQKRQEMAQLVDAQNFFLSKGVPQNRLTLNQGYDALVNSGWQFIEDERQELQRLRQGGGPKENQAKQRKPAPSVVTDKGTPGNQGTTWAELRKKYGSDEAVYSLVEQGILDATIIPTAK